MLFTYLFLLLGLALTPTVSAEGECGGETCIEEGASCVDNECVCDDQPNTGDPTLACYRHNEFGAHVVNDPRVTTFNGNRIGLPYPCRYLFTHFITRLKDRSGNVVGECEFVVKVFHGKDKGKIIVDGYDLAVRIAYTNGTTHKVSIRTSGFAFDGDYQYFTNVTWGEFWMDGPWYDHELDYNDRPNSGLVITLFNNNETDAQELEIKKCGYRQYFRPYDVFLRLSQPRTPGFALAINCAFHPRFESNDTVMALPPTSHGGFNFTKIEIVGLTTEQAFVDRAFRSGIAQNQPNAGTACAEVKDALDNCTLIQRIEAYTACFWILISARYIKCLNQASDTCDPVVGMFKNCVDVFCSGANCTDFQHSLGGDFNCETIPGYPDLVTWNMGGFC